MCRSSKIFEIKMPTNRAKFCRCVKMTYKIDAIALEKGEKTNHNRLFQTTTNKNMKSSLLIQSYTKSYTQSVYCIPSDLYIDMRFVGKCSHIFFRNCCWLDWSTIFSVVMSLNCNIVYISFQNGCTFSHSMSWIWYILHIPILWLEWAIRVSSVIVTSNAKVESVELHSHHFVCYLSWTS